LPTGDAGGAVRRLAGGKKNVPGASVVLLRLNDHGLVDDLCQHFDRSGFRAESFGGGMVGVSHPSSPDHESEQNAIVAHLGIWRIANPSAEVDAINPT
jgi:hypothetical protein